MDNKTLLERVSTLENVVRSLVATALENPDAIDWTELSQFFIETDKG